MANSELELRSLLIKELPLDKVGPKLRERAQSAACSNDTQSMASVANEVVWDLLCGGEIMRVTLDGGLLEDSPYFLVKSSSRLLNLSAIIGNQQVSQPPKPRALSLDRRENDPAFYSAGELELFDISQMLGAMQAAQDLKPGQSTSGETGNILQTSLELLQAITPQVGLYILLFEGTETEEERNRLFYLDQIPEPPPWLELRPPEHSAYLTSIDQLPWKCAGSDDGDSDYSSAAAIPIYEPPPLSETRIRAKEIGLLFLVTGKSWSRGSALKLGTQFSRFVTQRWEAQRDVDNKIHVDALTGLFNRRFFDEHFPLLLERAKRSEKPLALIVADIDLFKAVNSEHGLLVGDQVLQMVAERLQELVRRVDVVCRRGGEEFAIILPEAGLDAAREVITRLLNSQYSISTVEGETTKTIRATLSFGVTVFPDNGTDGEKLHFQAESAMFESKNNGRHRCHYWQSEGSYLLQKPLASSE